MIYGGNAWNLFNPKCNPRFHRPAQISVPP